MAEFTVTAETRFTNDFRIQPMPGYAPTQTEAAYLAQVEKTQEKVARNVKSDEQISDVSIRIDLDRLYGEIADKQRSNACEFIALPTGQLRDEAARKYERQSHYYEGVMAERRARIKERPFEVSAIPRHPNLTRPIADINIITRDVAITDDQQRFKVEVDRTITVLKVVLGDRHTRWKRFIPAGLVPGRLKGWLEGDRVAEDAARRLDEYLFALLSLTKVGLMNLHPAQAPFAKLALLGLQEEFVAREAGYVKNSYVIRLGCWAFLFAIAALTAFFLSELTPDTYVLHRFRRFFLLASGAAVGTWLSFSLRRVVLKFDDLAALEDDRLNPGVRILFVVTLTTVVGLLLWTNAIRIEMGGFSSDFRLTGSHAALIGALCGIAERSLATAVTKRAGDFTASIGGTKV